MSKRINLNEDVSVTFDKNYVYIKYYDDNSTIKVGRVKELIDVHSNAKTSSFIRFLKKNKIIREFKKEYKESSWNSEYASLDEFLEDKGSYDLIGEAFRWSSTARGNKFWCHIDDKWDHFTEVPHIGIHAVKFCGDKIYVGCQIIDIDYLIGLWKIIQMQS